MNLIKKLTRKHINHPVYSEGKSAFSNGLDISDNAYIDSNEDTATIWESGWHEALQNRKTYIEKINKKKSSRRTSPWFEKVLDMTFDVEEKIKDKFHDNYDTLGLITAVITFISCWIYAIISWGFLLGLGLGWIPSLFIAVIAGFLWPLIAIALIVGIAVVVYFMSKSG